jgi:hypothetical protein
VPPWAKVLDQLLRKFAGQRHFSYHNPYHPTKQHQRNRKKSRANDASSKSMNNKEKIRSRRLNQTEEKGDMAERQPAILVLHPVASR